jgi:hypothetical protein
MATVSDLKFEALRGLGFTGTLSDMTLQWLQDNGATSDALSDAWLEFLAIELDTDATGVRVDDWFAYLGAEGHTGSISDRELQFWQDQVDALPP